MNRFVVPAEVVERVCRIVANHHSARDIDTIEFRIVWDADWLVNLPSDFVNASREQIQETIDKVFKTNTGHKMAVASLLETDAVKPGSAETPGK